MSRLPKPPHKPATKNNKPPQRPAHRPPHVQSGGDPRLLFGVHAVAAAWCNPARRVRRLLATESGLEALHARMGVAQGLGLTRPQPILAQRPDLDKLVPGAVHQGLVLDAEPLEETTLDDILIATANQPATLIVLDQITDPHNIGAILRSASAFGAAALIALRHNAPDITGTLAKTASGAVEDVPYVQVPNLARAMAAMMDAGFLTIALDERGEKTLAEHGPFHRTALIMGAEGEGLRRLTRETAQFIARLPTGGPVGSLNVSNAAAVALYEVKRSN
jgi:23S rRNA (guanosine2251-2'-O)-methyltransferase